MPNSAASSDHEIGHWFNSDEHLHHLYPRTIQALAKRHWTPLKAARLALEFLVPHAGVKVLDIGSGAGKFCLAGAYYKPDATFYGIEQRKDLVVQAKDAKKSLGLRNVFFIQGNFTKLDLRQYDHFYFYNSFYENLKGTPKIDYNLPFSETLYNKYNRHLSGQLEAMPSGTRMVARCSWEEEAPPTYTVVESDPENMLRFFIKA